MTSASNSPTDPLRSDALSRRDLERSWPTRNQLEFELSFFAAILLRDPYYVDALKVHAKNLTTCHRHDLAVQLDRRLVALQPQNSIAWYNLACDHAMLNQVDLALDCLERALALGYPRPDRLGRDPELRNLHREPRFLEWLVIF